MRIVLCSLFLGVPGWVVAQPEIQWQNILGGSDYDQASSIQQTNDGGYIVAGQTLSADGDIVGNHGFTDCWVVKLTEQGLQQWKKTFGGTSNDLPYAIKQTSDGGFVLAGMTESFNGDVSFNHGFRDAWVVKLNSLGDLEWEKALGGTAWEEARCIEQTTDGGYVVAGRANSTDGDVTGNHAGSLDFWVVKLSDLGQIEWQKSLGGNDEDTAHSVKQTADGGYIVVGEAKSTDGDVSGNNGNVDFWVVKLSNQGELEWQNALGGNALDVGSEIHETSDGYIACGYVGSHNTGDVTGHHSSFDFWIVKLSMNGELLWQKTLGGNDADWGYAGTPTADGGYVVAGATRSEDGDVETNNGGQDIWIVKVDASGELIWEKSIGGTNAETAFDIQQTIENGFIIAGFTWSNDGDVIGINQGYNDFWIVKLSPESTPTHQPNSQPLNLYPNPATQSITIQTPDTESLLNIQITDLLGREFGRQTISKGGTVGLERLPVGIYLVSANTESGKVYMGRVCKQE